MTMTCERKETMYRTAIARISCAKFQAGECVRVLWTHVHDGVDWYIVAPADATKGTVAYPAHHLESFVL